MAFETPGSILIRRMALAHQEIYHDLFAENRLPTLAQYNPAFVSFNQQDGQILLTGRNAAPFVRYKIGDRGGVYAFSQIDEIFAARGINLAQQAKKYRVPLSQLPFVYIYERSDLSTTLYGLQIYPQTIKKVLETPVLSQFVTGKFSLETAFDRHGDQFLQIHVELRPKTAHSAALRKLTEGGIIKQLLAENSEYRELSTMLSQKRTKPRITFWPYNHETHFKQGVKQQWIKK